MRILATNTSDAFDHVIWTLLIPCMVGAAIAGVVLKFLIQGIGNFLARKINQVRGMGPSPKRSKSARAKSERYFSDALPSSPSTMEDTAPHCPTCNRVMVNRTARRGARQGKSFWGCPAYPECRGTRET